jgi:hypothetical protein
MAKEYIIEKAFRKTVSKDDKTPATFTAHDKVMWPWMVKVEGEDFWFQKTTLENGKITPGDTIFGLFDEETVTPKNGGETFTVKKFVKVPRPDGTYDKVQARDSDSDSTPKTTNNTDAKTEARLSRLEEQLGLPPIEWSKDANPVKDEGEDKPLDPSELPL